MIEQRLQVALATTEGGADRCLYLGQKTTRKFAAKLSFGQNGYEFSLVRLSTIGSCFFEETVFHGEFRPRARFLGFQDTMSPN